MFNNKSPPVCLIFNKALDERKNVFGDKLAIKTPLRVSWDLTETAELNENTLSMYERIKERFLFEFNLLISGGLARSDQHSFWDAIQKTLLEVNLILASSPETASADFINRYQFRQVQVDWSDLSQSSLKLYQDLKGEKAVRFILQEQNLSRVCELLELVRQNSVSTLIFANPVIDKSAGNGYLFSKSLLRSSVKPFQKEFLDLERHCKIQVHDLCSEELMFGQRRREGNYAGCQAGLYLAYVTGDGQVYGCSSLPISIGDLTTSNWESIWQSEPRKILRSQIEQAASDCAQCKTFNHCKGGCRGLSWIKHGDFNHPDILCKV